MLLAITALGYATVWIDGALRAEDRAQRIGQLLGVPPNKPSAFSCPSACPPSPARSAKSTPSTTARGSIATGKHRKTGKR